jgi:uncharacterized coiled-coil protein SlyX
VSIDADAYFSSAAANIASRLNEDGRRIEELERQLAKERAMAYFTIGQLSDWLTEARAELATAHRRIEHLTARMRYWRTQATGYPDSRQQREARRKGA